jgi:uncharacterized protein (TIGR02300 family)
MPRAEWGVKRTCPNCETRFYDLQRTPVLCPECGVTYNVDDHGKVSAMRERRVLAPVAEDEEALVDEEDLVEDTEGDEEDPLLAEDDEDEEPAGPTLSDEDGEEDDVVAVAFQDPDLIEDDDEDVQEDDPVEEDEIDDLDDVPGKDKSD